MVGQGLRVDGSEKPLRSCISLSCAKGFVQRFEAGVRRLNGAEQAVGNQRQAVSPLRKGVGSSQKVGRLPDAPHEPGQFAQGRGTGPLDAGKGEHALEEPVFFRGQGISQQHPVEGGLPTVIVKGGEAEGLMR